MKAKEFIEKIKEQIPDDIGLKNRILNKKIIIETSRLTGIQMIIEISKSGPEIYFYHRTTSWEYEGERSDLHDIISSLFASFVKLNFNISCSLHDLPHPAIETSCEIYARYIIPRQIDRSYLFLDSTALDNIVSLIIGLSVFEIFFWNMAGCPCESCIRETNPPFLYRYEFSDDWLERVNKAVKSKSNKLSVSNRNLPNWNYYKNYTSNISVIKSTNLNELFQFQYLEKLKEQTTIQGVNGEIFFNTATYNFLSFKIKSKIIAFFKSIDNIDLENISILPMENIVVAFGKNHFIIIESSGGYDEFNYEKSLLQARHQNEYQLLFKYKRLKWKNNISPEKFEDLIKDLLEREPGVIWVRKVSHTNESDGGRDLIAEWRTISSDKKPTSENKFIEGQTPYKTRKIIIQCKTSNNGISKNEVCDIRDTVEHHSYDGYFLAVSSYTKRSLTDALDKIKNQEKIWIDWWTGDEIEKKILLHPDLIYKYSSILYTVDI